MMIPLIATALVTILSILTIALALDPSRPEKQVGSDGRPLHLPPTVPWSFILLRLGNMRNLVMDMHKHYGDVVCIHFPFSGFFVLPLGNRGSQWFHSASINDMNDLMVLVNRFTAKFPDTLPYAESTKLIIRSFTKEFYQNVIVSLQDILRVRVASWADACEKGDSFDVFDQAHHMVLDVNTKVMFGNDWDEKDLADYKKAFIICDPAYWLAKPIHMMFPSLGQTVREKANELLVNTAVRQAQKHIETGLKPDESSLDFFLTNHCANSAAATTWGLEMASFVTTASAASWLLYHLAEDPKLQQRVRDEMELAVRKGEKLSLEMLQSQMPFMDSMCREIVRAHAHGPNARSAMADLKFGEYDIPKGSTVTLLHVTVHCNEENFEDPLKFKPDRFIDEAGQFDASDLVRSSRLVSFGAGRHPCLGMRLAVTELKILAYELVSNYDIKLINKPILPSVTAMGFEQPKNSVRFVVSRR
ncbi:cytochrome P450 [Cladochytrium replicatum]|nr:cytochrome P450 [Cladochytrium replicatum]